MGRAGKGGGASGWARKEVVGRVRMRLQRSVERGGGGLVKQGCSGGDVWAIDLAVSENAVGATEKLKKGLGGFQTHLYSSVNQ
jgi:hypothetical protein